jgi:hypothetical protein
MGKVKKSSAEKSVLPEKVLHKVTKSPKRKKKKNSVIESDNFVHQLNSRNVKGKKMKHIKEDISSILDGSEITDLGMELFNSTEPTQKPVKSEFFILYQV